MRKALLCYSCANRVKLLKARYRSSGWVVVCRVYGRRWAVLREWRCPGYVKRSRGFHELTAPL
ncbi:MAG: hypothetical protein DRJ97_06145 [Thermoprotei archaeon]|nr:MAG: hypothetical protein DRJ97_06145 [Thermoprotei archaeon]